MELWNRKDILPPPNNSTRMHVKDLDVLELKRILRDALKSLNLKYILHKEAAVFSRYLYKNKRIFRGHKKVLVMEKVKRCLHRYISLNLEAIYDNFYKMISFDEDGIEDHYYGPTKQMLEYLLVQTQSFSQIMFCAMTCCEEAAHYIKYEIASGLTLRTTLLAFSLQSRIWYCAKYYVLNACLWYSKLKPYLDKLKIVGISWLPEDYIFPIDLRTWLGPDPMTGKILPCPTAIQNISGEIQHHYNAQDKGVIISRKEFAKAVKGNCDLSKNRFTQTWIHTKYDKLLANIDNSVHSQNNSICGIETQLINNKTSNLQHSKDTEPNTLPKNNHRTWYSDIDSSKSKFSETSAQEFETTMVNPSLESNPFHLFMSSTVKLCNTSRIGEEKDFENNEALNNKVFLKNMKSTTSSMMTSFPSSSEIAEESRFDSKVESQIISNPTMFEIQMNDVNMQTEFSHDTSALSKHKTKSKKNKKKKKKKKKKNKKEKLALSRESNLGNIYKITNNDRDTSSGVGKEAVVGNVEVVEKISSIKEVKVFLQKERKARAKGKNCVTSLLNASDWNTLRVAIDKSLKKVNNLKLKGKKLTEPVLEEIKSTIIALI